jgi:hypothetical protein
MAGNPLNSTTISELMSSSLPKNHQELKNPYETLALTTHACMIALGFRLVGLGEDDKFPAPPHDSEASSQTLPTEWNSSSTFSFRYSHTQSSLQYLIKISRLGNKAIFYGLAPGDDKTASFEVTTSDFVDSSKYPTRLEEGSNQLNASILLNTFHQSTQSLNKFSDLLKTSIIQKLMPGLWKEGYEETRSTRTSGQGSSDRGQSTPQAPYNEGDPSRGMNPQPGRPYLFHDPLAAGPPRRPIPAGDFPPPGFEDEYEINRPRQAYPPGFGGRHPLSIGDDDLYPPGLGPRDPLGGPFRPGGGLGGGMHPDFMNPSRNPGGIGGGGMGYDPQHPPGARYDPVGPGGEPRDIRGGPRFPGRGPMDGGPPNPFGGFGDGDFL